jgi:hypothetical protein
MTFSNDSVIYVALPSLLCNCTKAVMVMKWSQLTEPQVGPTEAPMGFARGFHFLIQYSNLATVHHVKNYSVVHCFFL